MNKDTQPVEDNYFAFFYSDGFFHLARCKWDLDVIFHLGVTGYNL